MRSLKSNLIIFLILFLSVVSFGKVLSTSGSDSTVITVKVGEETVVCVVNNFCDTASGETESNCSADCGCNNNKSCESNRGESESSCPSDCATVPPVVQTNTDSVVYPVPENERPVIPAPDIIPPANINLFEAEAGDTQVSLKWQSPKEEDFAGLRIVRSGSFYPSNPWEGDEVYSGSGENFLDHNLENGKRYYYSAFSYDKSGNFSSGAIVSAVPFKEGVPIITPPEIRPGQMLPEIEKLNLKEFEFFQGDRKIEISELGEARILQGEPLKISIKYDKIPEVLKTIMVTLEEQGGKMFSFLLRVNKEKTVYEAAIYPPQAGNYPLILTILDYKNQSVKKIKGELDIIPIPVKTETSSLSLWQKILSNKSFYIIIPIILIILLIIILIIARQILKKRKEKKENEYGYMKKYR
jgi:hypothetical protein